MVDCSEKLKMLRETRGLTQLQVANRIGVSKAMISAYETASKAPSIEVLIRLSRLFGVSVDYLVCVDTPKVIDVSGLDDETIALISALVEKYKVVQKFS
nr:helix-turn-helix transcriptional regulator [uncultured Oscillibacter sp.]